ncbi:MAG: hypothetical protein H6736_20425 [Alphaproteobacteria bacterium]|nr:hypothetical protein [Alphaproteobacteria bacterium]
MSRAIAVVSKMSSVDSTLRAIRSGALDARVVHGTTCEEVLAQTDEAFAIFCDASELGHVLDRCGDQQARVFALGDAMDEQTLATCVGDHRVGGIIAVGEKAERPWELTYVTRRMVAPEEGVPHMGNLLAWGAATLTWTPRTTTQLRQIVDQVEKVCIRLGVERWQAAHASTAAHELLMNAMYDAPRDTGGKARYALDRSRNIELEDHEVPTLVFTITGEHIGLDVIDNTGLLPRRRFYHGILRGHRNAEHGDMELDKSHGGAGLGLHTLFRTGSVLRAELLPRQRTHVSWMLDRRVPRRDQRAQRRSVLFIPRVPRQVIDLEQTDLSPL